MKSVTFIGKNNYFSEVQCKLNDFFKNGINIKFMSELDSAKLDPNTLYVLSVNDLKDLDETKNQNFVVVSENLAASESGNLISECYKRGTLECMINPENSTMIFVKIKRLLTDFQYEIIKEEIITLKMNDVIRKDIKGAGRGKYDYTLLGIHIEATSKKDINEVKSLLKSNIRETDTLTIYNENILLVSMPFCDKSGSVIVKEKLKKLINTNLKFKTYLTSATLDIDGKTECELINLVSEGLNNVDKKIIV
ncbi:hypothetical protein [Clostridium estertheticum]|uniref:hypothetical protein n=1 Tax=Clostridium estertheticum TaxID=238834 RepID=UPI001C0E61F3|nr:hypothetical protein [Clostridium estertheticum]MBU3173298.1 hypothetical protein [Clostridium estertheticum]